MAAVFFLTFSNYTPVSIIYGNVRGVITRLAVCRSVMRAGTVDFASFKKDSAQLRLVLIIFYRVNIYRLYIWLPTHQVKLEIWSYQVGIFASWNENVQGTDSSSMKIKTSHLQEVNERKADQVIITQFGISRRPSWRAAKKPEIRNKE
jgi:hypothetical protein